jgi:hypothetical protein
VIYVGAILLCCSIYGGFRILAWSIPHLIGAVRYRSKAISDDDILLTHEADEDLSEENERYAADLKAWEDAYAVWLSEQGRDVRKRAEKFGGDR